MNIYCSEPGYGPEDSQIQLNIEWKERKEGSSTKNEHIMRQ